MEEADVGYLIYYRDICQEGLKKTTKTQRQYSRSLGQDYNSGPPVKLGSVDFNWIPLGWVGLGRLMGLGWFLGKDHVLLR
jgi:hypothetical protein